MIMARNRDILLDTEVDIMFSGKDFAIGDSTRQNQYLILAANKGEFKENPFIGAGVGDMVGDEGSAAYWKHRIGEELKRDGMTVEKIEINGNEIKINAEYR